MTTKHRILILVIILIAFISSCSVQSFYALYTEDVLIRKDAIIGKWDMLEHNGVVDEETLVWEISFDPEQNVPNRLASASATSNNRHTYTLSIYRRATPDKKTVFLLHVVQLDDKIYFDFFPEAWELDNDILGLHLMGVHTFAKVDIESGNIVVNWFDVDAFGKKLEANKIRIKHEKNQANILLTAQPKELQKFVIKYSNDKDAFDESLQVVLKPQK